MTAIRALVGVVTVFALLAGCQPAPAASGDPLADFSSQRPRWKSCEQGQCAEVSVPLDYANPDGQRLTLALARRPATEKPRLGTLFVNPGGPGGSGRDMVAWFDPTGLEQYDIVGWDPRGVGASSPVQCLTGAEADAHLAVDASPDTPAEREQLLDAARRFAEACRERTGQELLAHVSTTETVRDLDILRAVVGDEKLTYLGYSYGTHIGALYAELFPARVGRLVLDSAMTLTEPENVPQSLGFDRALARYARSCADAGCSLGGSTGDVVASIRTQLDALDAQPLDVDGRPLTQTLAASGVAMYLYGGSDTWPLLTRALEALSGGDGSALLAAADQLNGREPDGSYSGLFSAFPAVICADATPRTLERVDELWRLDQETAPFFGHYFGPQYTCAAWPVEPNPPPEADGAGAAPLLVIGAAGDPATPFEWALEMSESLESAVLITYSGEGHGVYGGRSTCVDGLVRSFLVQGAIPGPTTCD